MAPLIAILNGPNLNLLGQRQPELYGYDTLEDVGKACAEVAKSVGLRSELFQSNHEGALIDMVHAARETSEGIIINPAALTHTSVALLDALQTFVGPVLEVHISNTYAREEFRHKSLISKIAKGVLCGFGAEGYIMALEAMKNYLKNENR